MGRPTKPRPAKRRRIDHTQPHLPHKKQKTMDDRTQLPHPRVDDDDVQDEPTTQVDEGNDATIDVPEEPADKITPTNSELEIAPATPVRRLKDPATLKPKHTPRTTRRDEATVLQTHKERYKRHAERAKEYEIGPMPFRLFLDDEKLSPPKLNNENEAPWKRASEALRKGMCALLRKKRDPTEQEYTTQFVSSHTFPSHHRLTQSHLQFNIIQKTAKRKIYLIPNFRTCDTQKHSDTTKAGGSKPDAQFERDNNGVVFEKDASANFKGDFWLEWSRRTDCYDDPPEDKMEDVAFMKEHTFHKTSDDAVQKLGQLTCYDAYYLARQFRTLLYSIFVVGTHARVRRTDRAGTLVTRAVDISTEAGAEMFCEFLWRMGHASAAQLGHDLSHIQASAEQEEEFKRVITENYKLQNMDGSDETPSDDQLDEHYVKKKVTNMRVYCKKVPELDGPRSRGGQKAMDVLICRPLRAPENGHGRGTRPYWCAVWDDVKKCWRPAMLKDCWRPEAKGLSPEGSNLETVVKAAGSKCTNVPTLFGHGDVKVPEGFKGPTWPEERDSNQCEPSFTGWTRRSHL